MKQFVEIEDHIIAIDAIAVIYPGNDQRKTTIRLLDGTGISITTDHRFELRKLLTIQTID